MSRFLHRFDTAYFFQTPVESKVVYFWLGLYLTVIVTNMFFYLYFRKKEKPYRAFAKKTLYTVLPVSVLGLFFVFGRYEYLRTFSWRFWQYLTLLGLIASFVWLYLEWKKMKLAVAKFHTKARKEKWLKASKKAKK
jgi:amino acid transporter